MEKKPRYHSVQARVPLSDPLALDRTVLANERTFLAYIRTSLTLMVTGITFISFFPQNLVIVLGWTAILPAIILFLKGSRNYYQLKKHLEGHDES